MGTNPLFLRGKEADEEIRRRLRGDTQSQSKTQVEHSFQQVIRIYEKLGDRKMADLLRLDWQRLSRFL